jgi:hypothetical protein
MASRLRIENAAGGVPRGRAAAEGVVVMPPMGSAGRVVPEYMAGLNRYREQLSIISRRPLMKVLVGGTIRLNGYTLLALWNPR